MGARSSNTNRKGHRSQSDNRLLNGHVSNFFNSRLNAGAIGPNAASPAGHTASGGLISDYTHPDGTIYRSHIFTRDGTFTISKLGTVESTVDYLVIGAGAGGGYNNAGGGGAGGLRSSVDAPGGPGTSAESAYTVSATSYPVTIGLGGDGGSVASATIPSTQGGHSYFGPGPAPLGIRSAGGGTGGDGTPTGESGGPGGSSGGGAYPGQPAGAIDTTYGTTGYVGGVGGPMSGAGGGGAGGIAGSGAPGPTGGDGGAGLANTIVSGPVAPLTYAGGGGGGAEGPPTSGGEGGTGGGAQGSAGAGYEWGQRGQNTGAGGGGGGGGAPNSVGGMGGDGLVVIRYKLLESQGTAKATGGAISYYGGNVIHAFTSPGTFTCTDPSPLTVNYVAVGGGGASTTDYGGGGGAGGVITNIPGMMPGTTAIPVIAPGAPTAWTINVGQGGNGTTDNVQVASRRDGGPSTIVAPTGTLITATGGGGATPTNSAPYGGGPGGSGGGGRGNRSPDAGGTGTAGQGNDGGAGNPGSPYRSGGGGGAGGNGSSGSPTVIGHGGLAVQLPAVFQDPQNVIGAPGPGGDGYWVGGGGGGGSPPADPDAGEGGGPGGPYGGGGEGTHLGWSAPIDGWANTGGGGGGTSETPTRAGAGGSGIVLIYYTE